MANRKKYPKKIRGCKSDEIFNLLQKKFNHNIKIILENFWLENPDLQKFSSKLKDVCFSILFKVSLLDYKIVSFQEIMITFGRL